MIKPLILIFLISLFSIVNIYSQPFDMILTGDPVLEDIRYLSLVANRPFLSFSPPLAPQEVKNFLDLIDDTSLSLPAREAYFRVLERLNPKSNISWEEGIFHGSLNVNSTLVGRTRFNDEISLHPHYPKIVPFAAFPLKLSFAEAFQLYIEPSAAIRPDEYGKNTGDFNIPTGYYTYNESNPLRAFAAAGNSWLNFQIGRDRLYWGSGHTGGLVFSDNSQFFDFARLSVFGTNFKYSLVVNQMQLELNQNLFRNDSKINSDWLEDPDNMTRSIHRYFYLHRFDFSIKDRVSIGIMEGVMVGNSPLELKYLNPVMLFHALFSWEDYDTWDNPEDWEMGDINGSILSLEINWNIVKNFAAYGQFVLNDFAAPGEKGLQPPNGLGYMAGIQYAHSFNIWASIFFLEFIYTDPYLNLLSSPFASFIQMNRFNQYYFLGYPRDTVTVTLGTRFFNNDFLSFSASFSWIASGELNSGGTLKWDWELSEQARNKVTPTGITENKYILSIGAGWKPHPFVFLQANIAGIISVNNNHIDGETAVGGQATFSVGFHY